MCENFSQFGKLEHSDNIISAAMVAFKSTSSLGLKFLPSLPSEGSEKHRKKR